MTDFRTTIRLSEELDYRIRTEMLRRKVRSFQKVCEEALELWFAATTPSPSPTDPWKMTAEERREPAGAAVAAERGRRDPGQDGAARTRRTRPRSQGEEKSFQLICKVRDES